MAGGRANYGTCLFTTNFSAGVHQDLENKDIT